MNIKWPVYRQLEKAMAPHSSTLAWKIPWTEEPGRLQSMGSKRVGHNWPASLSLFTFMHWRRKWQLTPVFLPGESQGRGSLVGCRLWGHTELDMTEATQQQQQCIYVNSQFVPSPLPPSSRLHVHSLRLHLYSCLQMINLYHFSRFYMCVNMQYPFFSFWRSSLYIVFLLKPCDLRYFNFSESQFCIKWEYQYYMYLLEQI